MFLVVGGTLLTILIVAAVKTSLAKFFDEASSNGTYGVINDISKYNGLSIVDCLNISINKLPFTYLNVGFTVI